MPINKDVIRKVAGPALVAVAVFTAGFEGTRNAVYVDPVGIKTVCAGHAYTGPDGKPLQLGTQYSDDVCSYMLGQDELAANQDVHAAVAVPLSKGEELAYTDFVFNAGRGSFRSSTLLRKLNSGDHVGACQQLLLWTKGTVHGKKVELPGLVKRRRAEYKACMGQ